MADQRWCTKRKYIVAFMSFWCSGLMIGMLNYSFGVFVPAWDSRFGWSRTTINSAFSVCQCTSSLVSPAVGKSVDQHGPRLIASLSLLLCAGAWLIIFWMESLWVLYLAFFTAGVGFSGTAILQGSKLVGTWFPGKQRGRVMGIVTSGNNFGGLIMSQLATHVKNAEGWRWAAFVFFVITVVLALFYYLLVRDSPDDAGSSSSRGSKADIGTASSDAGQRVVPDLIVANEPDFIVREQILTEFYMRHNPTKLVDRQAIQILAQPSSISWSALCERLQRRYGYSPPSDTALPPFRPPSVAKGPPMVRKLTRSMLKEFYQKHNPAAIPRIDAILTSAYEDEVLLQRLRKKYGDSPLPHAGDQLNPARSAPEIQAALGPPVPELEISPAAVTAAAAPPVPSHHQLDLQGARQHAYFWFTAGGMMCAFTTYSGVLSQLIPALEAEGFGSTAAANVLALVGAMGFASKWVCGYVSEWITARRTCQLCLVTQICGIFLFVSASKWRADMADATSLFWFACALYGFGFGGIGAMLPLVAMETFGIKHFGIIFGAINASYVLPNLLAPIATGISFDQTSHYNSAFLGVAGVFGIGFVCLELGWPQKTEERRKTKKAGGGGA